MSRPDLPINAILDDLLAALRQQGRAVLQAPPGAGKSTGVPLALLAGELCAGKILMLEPRRLAARATAERMAQSLGEDVGARIGYRVRGEAKTSKQTRVEVVTEGILTRMIQSDPELSGIGAVIFDEFHERSIHADLGLALVLELRAALRPDLYVLVMSATLDAAPVAALLDDAPILTSEGRSFPVETRHLDKPLPANARFETEMAALIKRALVETTGGILAFLPGQGEIARTAAALGALPDGVILHQLYGAMGLAAQRAAILPATSGRKLVLATAIAETSLTLADIAVVVDGGKARRARFDPGSGMGRLVTERVSRAEADQRRGRAGRVGPGVAYRLWTKGEEGALPAFAPAEIETADLAPLALELALWGSRADEMAFLTAPPVAALTEAQALLTSLGALKDTRITDHGRALAALPLHPRLGHMLSLAGPSAAPLAALLSNRDPLIGAQADLALRLDLLRDPRGFNSRHSERFDRGAVETIRTEAKRLETLMARKGASFSAIEPAEAAALAYPDRIALRRKDDEPRYLLSGGKGAHIHASDALASAHMLVVTDTDGDPREARIRQAMILSRASLESLFADQITTREVALWSKRDKRVEARKQRVFGALVLEDAHWHDASPEALARGSMDGIRDIGLTFTGAAQRFVRRVDWMRQGGADYPDLSEAALMERLEDWALPFVNGAKTAAALRGHDWMPALRAQLSYEQQATLDREMPSKYTSPMGREVPIDYEHESPEIEVRLQEMFGVTRHPCVGPDHRPMRVTLTSPAGRPLQTTMDLPGFWANSYQDVRKDMRGRYPRHPWPEDPTQAQPTLRAKPRGT